jgi:hypothetical protein
MRKYKLIKKYPSINLNEADIVINREGIYFPVKGGNGIEPKHIENYPEFWQPVVEKVKTPLFKTEDLKEVFDQQRFYTVALENEFDDYFEIFEQSLYSASKSDIKEFLKSKDKHFSTRKAAKEYVLMNNPCLSIQDVLNKLDFEQEDRFITMELLKDLVKSKNK